MVNFKDGVEFYLKNSNDMFAGRMGDAYIDNINDKINILSNDINKFIGKETPIEQLKGNMAEFWHADTYNLDSAIKGFQGNAKVLESNGYASVDVNAGGQDYGFKYYSTFDKSAKAQAISHFEKYKRTYPNGEVSFEQFLKDRGIDDTSVMNDPIYSGQVRVVPSDQLIQAKEFLKKQIAKEEARRPALAKRYQDTYNKITDIIEDNKGNKSIELTKKDSELLAKLGKEGKFNPAEWGLSTEELVKFEYVFKQAFKAGITSATISLVIRTAPEIYKALDYLFKNGEIDKHQFEKIGYSAIQGTSEGFIRGTISASIVVGCESGLLGAGLKNIDPSIIGAVTVLAYNTMKNATEVAKGNMTRNEMTNELIKELFITTGAMSIGTLTQNLIPVPVLGFMIGSFAGSLVGTFVYNTGYSIAMSFFTESGYTMFGLVEQDYKLPDNILKDIGIEVFNYDKVEQFNNNEDKFEFDTFKPNIFKADSFEIKYLSRGVIGINKIGYTGG